MRTLYVLFTLLFLSLIGCETTDHEGYKRLKESVHFKLLAVGDESKRVDEGSYISLQINLKNQEGRTIANKQVKRVIARDADWPEIIKQQVLESVEGDSFSLIGEAGQLGLASWFSPIPFEDDKQTFQVILYLDEVLSEDELRQLRAEERLMKDMELDALKAYKRTLDSLGFSEEDRWEGIYYRQTRPGNGVKPESGSLALYQYRAFLSNGKKVDDTYAGEPFEYHMGKPDQAIDGFRIAASRMTKGEQALVVIPSSEAYGEKGSSSGIIPPYATLIYEVELVEVR